MGNFEKLSVLVIVVIIVMILVVALYTWTDNPDAASGTNVAVEQPSAPIERAPAPPIVVPGPVGGAGGPAPVNVPAPVNPQGGGSLKELLEQASVVNPIPVVAGPPAQPEPPKPVEPRLHVVEAGQTIGSIAKTYYPGQTQRGTKAILEANPTVVPESMRVGTKLTIPELAGVTPGPATPASGEGNVAPKPVLSIQRGGSYVTKRGDTLPGIAKRAYGKDERWPDIYVENFDALNGETGPLDAGIRLRIPR